MPTVPTQIRIDPDVKAQASALFANLGLDMSSAVNLFLRQCVLRGGSRSPWRCRLTVRKHWRQWLKRCAYLATRP